jgi:translocation and assembly module TamB
LARGVATVDELRGLLHGAPVRGFGRVRLEGAYPYEAVLNLQDADLRALQDLKPELRPPMQLRGTMALETSFQGTLAPLTYKDTGSVRARDVIVEGVTADSLSFRWETMPDRVFLYDIDARLYQGRVTGSALLPLAANVPATADLELQGVQVEALARRLLGRSLQLQGLASGAYRARWGAAGADGVRENTTQLDLSAPLLRVAGFGVKQAVAHVDARRGTTAYRLTGSALDGKLELAGTLPRAGEPVAADAPATGRLTLDRGRLSRLGEALRVPLDPLRGQVSLDVEYRHGPDLWPVGRGRVFFKDLRWHTELLTETLRADLTLGGGEVRVSDVSGGVGGGELRGRIALNLKNPERGHFHVTLDRAEASQVVAPLHELLTGVTTEPTGPAAPPVQGALQVDLRGSLGREWRGSGNVVLTRGKVFGVEVTEWRWPVSFSYNLRHGRGQVDIHDSTAQLARGRAVGDASFIIGVVSRAEGSVRFTDLDLRTLVRTFGDVGSLAAGRVTGRLKFSGNQVRSLDDINATLDAALAQTQALELPVLRVLVPYVPPGTGSTTFQKGDLQARMSNGVIRVQHLSLASDLLKLVVEGTVTRQGRLNLEATTTTGNLAGLNNSTVLVLAREIPAAGPIPVAQIAQVSTLLANRAVHLRIGGTLRNPTVQLEPATLLTEEAIRLILGRVNVYVP